jgi:hypothetical protein
MEYERLTDKNDLYWALQETKLSAEVGIYLTDCLNRLAELEDKIEQGTLIELPCKVGDTVYWVWEEYTNGKQKLSIEEWEVEKICIEKNEWAVKGLGEELVEGVRQFFWCHSSKFGIWWFLTREEAESKLKELQECSK